MRRRAGPWRSVIVPTMISRSAWRGEKRGNSAPKRAMSYFGAATDMNSMPQQAVTNGYWNREYLRAQFAAASTLVVAKSRKPTLFPPDGALAPDVGEGHHQDPHEHQDLAETEERRPARAHARVHRARAGEVAELERPRIEERRLDVEDQEHDRHLVELHLEARARAADHVGAALVGDVLGPVRPPRADVLGQRRQQQREPDADEDHQRGGEVI